MRVGEIRQFCKLQEEGGALSLSKCQSLMRATMTQLNLSARAYHRIPWTALCWRIPTLPVGTGSVSIRPGQAETCALDCGFGWV